MSSIAFAQVSKKDTINKSPSRKVLNNDLKNLPPEEETNTNSGGLKANYHQKIKGEESSFQKVSDNNAREIKGTITQKGKVNDAMTTEKQNFTIKMSNTGKQEVATEQSLNDESAATTQKKHVANIKWTAGKVAKDTTANESKALTPYLKINGVKK